MSEYNVGWTWSCHDSAPPRRRSMAQAEPGPSINLGCRYGFCEPVTQFALRLFIHEREVPRRSGPPCSRIRMDNYCSQEPYMVTKPPEMFTAFHIPALPLPVPLPLMPIALNIPNWA